MFAAPERKHFLGKVMFLQLSVSNSVHKGCVVKGGLPPPRPRGTPPPDPEAYPLDSTPPKVNERVVRILLECRLVYLYNYFCANAPGFEY